VIIAVDGPAAAGKGTIARALAQHFGYHFLDTGTLYRRVGLALLETSDDPRNVRAAVAIARPPDTLFVDESVYAWRALDELAIATYYVGKRAESRALNERILSEGHLPASERPRILRNLEYSKDA